MRNDDDLSAAADWDNPRLCRSHSARWSERDPAQRTPSGPAAISAAQTGRTDDRIPTDRQINPNSHLRTGGRPQMTKPAWAFRRRAWTPQTTPVEGRLQGIGGFGNPNASLRLRRAGCFAARPLFRSMFATTTASRLGRVQAPAAGVRRRECKQSLRQGSTSNPRYWGLRVPSFGDIQGGVGALEA
jgi:hypothetical protein